MEAAGRRTKRAEIAASLPFKPTDIASIIRDARKLFDWITTGKLQEPRMLNDGETIEPRSGKDADTGPSRGGPPKRESPPMPAATTLDNVVEVWHGNTASASCASNVSLLGRGLMSPRSSR